MSLSLARRRNRWRNVSIVLAAVLAVGAATATARGLSSNAAAPACPAAPCFSVFGILRDASGNPTSGKVSLMLVADATNANVGDTVEDTLLSTTTADSDGAWFSLVSYTASVRAAALRNDNYVNLVARGFANGHASEKYLSKWIPRHDMRSASAGTLSAFDRNPVAFGSGQPAPKNSAVDLAIDNTTPMGPNVPIVCAWTLVGKGPNSQTKIGEVHNWWSDTSLEFTYGWDASQVYKADSDISVAYSKTGTGSWGLSGSVHIGDGASAYVKSTYKGWYQNYVTSGFDYGKFQRNPICGTPYRTQALQWVGGKTTTGWIGNDYDGQCNKKVYRNHYEAGDEFSRNSSRAGGITGAVSVFGASLSATSGFSRYRTTTYRFGPRSTGYWICGDNNYPPYSKHIYAGP